MRTLAAVVLCLALMPDVAKGETITSRAGARTEVAASAAPKFRALIRELEAHGAVIAFMGGYRGTRPLFGCRQDNKHRCGLALDVCQLTRGVVAHGQVWHGRRWPDCHMPGPAVENAIAAKVGLFHGARWCDGDRGHFEDGWSAACGESWAGRKIDHRDRGGSAWFASLRDAIGRVGANLAR